MACGEMGLNNRLSRRKKVFITAGLTFSTIVIIKLFKTPSPDAVRKADFMKQWCRIRNARVEWEEMLRPCRGNLAWGVKQPGWEPEHRTDPDTSYISLWDIRTAGEFSRLSIQTVALSGSTKTIGGDSWRVHLKGPASVAGTVFDLMNGTYEVVFLITKPGDYQVEVVLDHSLCDGLTEPPTNWFIVGELTNSRLSLSLLYQFFPFG